MANTDLKLGASGLQALEHHEGNIGGLYEDQSGYCTFGIGHLVHNTKDKDARWGCFFLAAAQGDDVWSKAVDKKWPGTKYETKFLRTTTKFDKSFDELKTKALGVAKEAIAQKKFKKAYDKLDAGQKEQVDTAATAAIDEQTKLLGQTAEDVLRADLTTYEQAVRSGVTGVDLEQDEYDALVCFTFNVGVEAFNTSTLLKKINENKYRAGTIQERKAAIDAIAAGFAEKNKSKGVVLDDLTKRRKEEADLFLKTARAQLAELEKAAAASKAAASPYVGAPPPVWQAPRLPGQPNIRIPPL
jgi:GH24 family phage-related lysozyme (muramidase)